MEQKGFYMENTTVKRLIQLRTQRNLTQGAVAQRLSLSRAAISRIESGLRNPSGMVLKKMAEFYHVPVDYLMGVDDSINPKQVIPYDPKYDPIIEMLKKLPDRDLEIVKMLIENLLEKQNISILDERKKAQ